MKNIAVLMGGYSSEYDISLRSGQVVIDALDKDLYTAYAIRILKHGWFYYEDDVKISSVDLNDFSIQKDGKKIVFDCCYNTVHGTPGEDGRLQAILELLDIPHTSSNFYASAVTFNKRDCLAVLKPYDLNMAKHIYLNQGDPVDADQIVEVVGLPCFVKANRSGSSYGVSKVYDKKDIPHALKEAYAVDDEIIIESFLSGQEISIGAYAVDGKINVLPPTEIVTENDFFDYEAKYEGKSQEITPARISQTSAQKVAILTEQVYKALKLKGLARVDFIFHNDEPHFVEVNTTPGLSLQSIVPQQISHLGLSLTDVFTQIIEDSIKQNA